jgi:hypothetical protein
LQDSTTCFRAGGQVAPDADTAASHMNVSEITAMCTSLFVPFGQQLHAARGKRVNQKMQISGLDMYDCFIYWE